VPGAEHPEAHREDAGPVALVEHGEGLLVAGPEAFGEGRVRVHLEYAPRRDEQRVGPWQLSHRR
jgi:hypothetical protein